MVNVGYVSIKTNEALAFWTWFLKMCWFFRRGENHTRYSGTVKQIGWCSEMKIWAHSTVPQFLKYGALSRKYQIQDKLVGGDRSQHCITPTLKEKCCTSGSQLPRGEVLLK